MVALCTQRWNETFPLGGLVGIPFAGKTGWHEFSNNCPEGGNLIILFAAHVGIDHTGRVGHVHRNGHKDCSSSCNAAIKAYFDLKSNQNDSRDSIKQTSSYLDH